ncbi:hypothetical protein jhhlp_003008 [Lomentospora prolificans]|uniref:Fibronectin type-III domain-containing protein n=1 Tax=Lomentospora prolificans TaxID=41688 RepID=A0A2N3NFS4_9PEZI|nr:hypothetical protein jhhlp_003008 [Lomentospora prolificans]
MRKFHALPLPLLLLLRASLASAGVVFGRDGDNGDNADQTFAAFTSPAEGDTLVTGSTVEVRWETLGDDADWGGYVMMEVADASQAPFTNFVYVDYDIPYTIEAHNWTIPERLTPGSYALRLANSSSPAIYIDSPTFNIIHAAPAPTEDPAPPSRSHQGLSSDDIIGLATGLSVAVLLAVLGIWAWRHSKNRERKRFEGNAPWPADDDDYAGAPRGGLGEWQAVRAGAYTMSPSTMVDTGSAAGEEGMAELDKLPEGVISGWAPEGISVEPIELPAEVYKRWSEEARERERESGSVGIEERLELSGSRGRDGTDPGGVAVLGDFAEVTQESLPETVGVDLEDETTNEAAERRHEVVTKETTDGTAGETKAVPRNGTEVRDIGYSTEVR